MAKSVNTNQKENNYIRYLSLYAKQAEKLYNKLVKEITNGITYDPAFNDNSSSSSPPVLSSSSDVRTTTSRHLLQSQRPNNNITRVEKNSNICALFKDIALHV
jgi:hypothetical protein